MNHLKKKTKKDICAEGKRSRLIFFEQIRTAELYRNYHFYGIVKLPEYSYHWKTGTMFASNLVKIQWVSIASKQLEDIWLLGQQKKGQIIK